MEKIDFDEWILEHYEEDKNRTGYFFNIPYIIDEYDRIKEYTTDEIINHYLEYYTKAGKITWNRDKVLGKIDEDAVTQIIFGIDEIILGELDTGESPQPMLVGNILFHNICEFFNSTNIPINPEGDFDGALLNIHPIIYETLKEWLGFYHPFMNWKDCNIEDFWECFVK